MVDDRTQEQKVLDFVKSRGIEGARKHEVMRFGLDNFITCADRLLRKLAEQKKVEGKVQEGEREKTWFVIGYGEGNLI